MMTKLFRILFLFTFFGLAAAAGNAQTGKCNLRAAELGQPPELLGFKLGMTAADVRALEPIVQIAHANALGFTETSFSPDFSPKADKAKYAGVRTISLQFLDGKLYSFWIGYTDSYKWSTEEDFLSKMTTALGLSADGWQKKGMGKIQNCDGLQAQYQTIARGPSIHLTDLVVKAVYDQRRAAAEAAKPDEPDDE